MRDTFRKLVGMMIKLSERSKHIQMGMKEGMRRHGIKAIQGLLKEVGQSMDKKIFCPRKEPMLTEESCRRYEKYW